MLDKKLIMEAMGILLVEISLTFYHTLVMFFTKTRRKPKNFVNIRRSAKLVVLLY